MGVVELAVGFVHGRDNSTAGKSNELNSDA